MNTIATGMNKMGLIDETGDLKLEQPLDKFRKEVRQEAIQNKETLLPGQVEYRVKQKFIEEKIREIHQSKMNLAKENLTPAEQYSLGLHKAQQISYLSKENKDAVKNMGEIKSSLDGMSEDAESMKKEYDRLGGKVSQEFVDKYNDMLHNISLNLALRDTYKTKYLKNQKDISGFEQEAAAYTSENNEMLDWTKRIQSWGYGALGNIHELTSKYIDKPIEAGLNALGNITSIPLIKGMGIAAKYYGDVDQQYSEEYAKKAQEIKEGREGVVPGVRLGGVTKTLGLNNINDYANELVAITGDNAGMTAALLAGGTIGLVGTAAETAGAKVREIRKENEEFKKIKAEAIKNKEINFEFNGEKYNTKEYANKDLHSDVASYVVPIAWGGAMILPMARQLKFLQGEARIAAALERQSPELLQKTLQEKSINWTKEYVGHSLGLARDLKIMGLAQAGLDDSLGKKVDYFEVATDLKGVRDAFILHGMNAGFAHVLGQTSRPYMTNEEAKTIDNNARLMSDLNNRLNFEQLTPESKVLVKKQLDRLQAESKVHIDNVIDRMSNMNDADYSKVIDLAKKSSDLRQEATDVQNSEFSNKEKQFALDKIKAEYLDNEKVLKYVKENYTPRTDGFFGLADREKSKLMDRASKELIADAKAKGEKEFSFSDRDIKLKAQEIFSRDNAPKEELATEEPIIKDSQIPLKRETFEFESAGGDILDVQVTTKKDGSRTFVAKDKDGRVVSSQRVGKDNTLTTEEYVTKGYGDIQGEPKVEQGNDIMSPATKDKLTPKQKSELGIEEPIINNSTETTIEEKKAEVEKLREQEQNEYKDVDSTDKVKLGEIYNKYDKLISPLLREIKAEGKTTEEVTTKGVEDVISKPIELDIKPTEVKTEEPTPPKTRRTRKTKEIKPTEAEVKPTEEVKVEETKQKEKEKVSLPKDINKDNVKDIIKQLVEKGIATKPC